MVDDEPDWVAALSAWLEDNGYEAEVATDGEQGLCALLAARHDLVLLDLVMPRSSGVRLYREMRARPELRDLPVVFVTGMAEVQLFGDDCVPLPPPAARIDKPVDREALLAVIRQAIG